MRPSTKHILVLVVSMSGCHQHSTGRPAVARLVLHPTRDTLKAGDTLQLIAAAFDSAGQAIPNAHITYRSSDTLLARVSESGRLVAMNAAGIFQAIASAGLATSTRLMLVLPPCTNMKTTRVVAVNSIRWPVAAGRMALTTQGRFESLRVVGSGGVVFGTDQSNLVVGTDPESSSQSTVTDLVANPICIVNSPTVTSQTLADIESRPGAPSIPDLRVWEETFASSEPTADHDLLYRYTFANLGQTTISNLYVGLLIDWDLEFGGATDVDAAVFNSTTKVAEMTKADTIAHPQIMGVVPIGPDGELTFRSFANDSASRTDYFGFLEEKSKPQRLGPTDIRVMVGRGPLTVAGGEILKVCFSIVGGEDRTAFDANVVKARAQASAIGC